MYSRALVKKRGMLMNVHAKSSESTLRSSILIIVFALVIPYYECVFNLSTVAQLFTWGTPIMLLFSVAFGLIGYLLVSLFMKNKRHHMAAIVWMILGAIPYLVQYFVYRGFLMFYDVTTMFRGAKDAVGGFSKIIFQLIFSFDGLFKIALFALPAVLFGIFGRRLYKPDHPIPVNAIFRGVAAVIVVFSHCLGLVMVHADDMAWTTYKTEYNYQSAVRHFGLLTAMRLDIGHLMVEEEPGGFEEVPTLDMELPTITTKPTAAPSVPSGIPGLIVPVVPIRPIEYGHNIMELNLSGGSGEIADLNTYVSSLSASKQNKYTGLFKGKNLIMITAEAFSAEVIDPELTPTLYRLATKGIQFTDFYQPASSGTTGGEYQNVFGMLPTAGGASFKNTADHYNYMTIGSQLDRMGYYGKAYHNNSYTFYSRHKTHNNLGYSDGFMGYGNGMEQYVKNLWPQSDLEMFQGTLPTYIDKEKFNIYYMTVSGHSSYTRVDNCMTSRNWELVQHLPYSDQIKGYLAANMELEKALAYLVGELEAKGIADDTVICLASDHFPYGLDTKGLEELYGMRVDNYFQQDHSACILWCGSLEKSAPIVVSTPTFSLDILPTLSNLFGTEFDSRLFPGRDVFSDAEAVVFNTNYDWKTEYGTYIASSGKFTPVEGVEVPDGYVERMKIIVRNKMRYCKMALDNDYFRYLFK